MCSLFSLHSWRIFGAVLHTLQQLEGISLASALIWHPAWTVMTAFCSEIVYSFVFCFVCGYGFLARSNMYIIDDNLFAWIWNCIYIYIYICQRWSEWVCVFVCWLFSVYIVVFWHCVLKVWIYDSYFKAASWVTYTIVHLSTCIRTICTICDAFHCCICLLLCFQMFWNPSICAHVCISIAS